MPVRCQDCNHHFLLDGTTVAQGISCPGCGGAQIERDQPSPTKSDGDLRNMVDPATQLDQGGNPLQEGVWAGVDGGWQPDGKRDEFFSKAAHVKSTEIMSSHDPRFYISMEPHMPWTHEAETKEAFLPALAPLALAGGRMLLGGALRGLMARAVMGAGNHLQAPEQQPEDPGTREVGLVASQRTAVGVDAPVETPHSTPDLVEDHDPESVDQQEFNDEDTSPAFNNPNNDNADGGMAQSTGEDDMHQNLEFKHDGDGVTHAEMILPLILEYINSDKSGLENPHIKALHETLEQEIPDYLKGAGDHDEEAVMKFLDSLKDDHRASVREAAPFLMPGAPMAQGQPMPQQAGPMPGTFQNPVQPGGMPVSGKCTNCGGVLNADGSCPQCGASAGANQQGNMEQAGQPGQQHLQTPGIMPSPYARQGGPLQDPQQNDPLLYQRRPEEQPRDVKFEQPFNNGRSYRGEGAVEVWDPQTRSYITVFPEELSRPDDMATLPHPVAADHQGPITPQQKEVFAQYLIEQGRNEEVAAMFGNPGIYADEWAQYLNRSTQPPEVDPAEQAPAPQVPPEQMGQMPVPGMSIPQPTAKTSSMGRCPKCESATTSPINEAGEQARCHRCGHIWETEAVPVKMSRSWKVVSFQDTMTTPGSTAPAPGASPNPTAIPAADATAPGDRSQDADSTLSWQDTTGSPLQVGQTYEMHNPNYAIPDVIKVEAIKPDGLTVTMVGEYNAPSDPQDANGPGYTHEIDLNEMQTEGLTFNPAPSGEGDQEQSQDNAQQDGIGQTVNTEPVEQPSEDLARHTHVELPTDHCPKCDYGHITSSYANPELVEYECYRCANKWQIEDKDPGADLGLDLSWIREDDGPGSEIGFDPRTLAMANTGKSRNIGDIAARDPRLQQIRERLNANKTAGAKFTPREQKEFIDEDGVARNADMLNLEGTHYESAFDNSKARPDRVNDNYLGLGL